MEGSIFTHKYTLVPQQFFSKSTAETLLGEVSRLESSETVKSIALEELGAVLVYSVPSDLAGSSAKPEAFEMLKLMERMSEYNKIICSIRQGFLNLLIAQGRSLLLLNSFPAQDFTTALYHIFNALKKFQLNPEMSNIHFLSSLSENERLTLYRYFKSVEGLTV